MNAILPVAVEGLAVHLGGSRILDDVALSVSSGESVAFLGANGSGKSTLVRAILGIVPASAGSVELFGKSVAARRSVPWSRIGYVPQRVTASSGVPATALEVVSSGLLGRGRLWGDVGPRAKRKALEALSAVGLEDRARDHVQVFSGGQAQRVLIARALVREPDLLFLDEPLAGIDRDSRRALASILSELRERGTTLVTVLHEMGELESIVERAVVLEGGRVVHDGAPPPPPPGHDHPEHDHVHPHDSADWQAHHAPTLRMDPS